MTYVPSFSIASITSPAVVEDIGGEAVTVSDAGITAGTGLRVFLGDGVVEFACYSGISGQGYDVTILAGVTEVSFVTPPLVIGGIYDVVIRNAAGALVHTIPAVVVAVARQWYSKVHSFRRLLPPKWLTGTRDTVTVPLLADGGGGDDAYLLEAFSYAVGLLLTEMFGYRYTRTTAAAAKAAATLPVESIYEWPVSGAFLVNGLRHAYTGLGASSLTGITHVDDTGTTQVGLSAAVSVSTAVIDFNRDYSALDQIRRAFLVNYATGDDLSVVGRNLGVLRPPNVDDDTYRALIKAIAYSSRGTLYAINLALTAFFGAGNFTVTEKLISHPNTVFIHVSGGYDLTASSKGRAFFGKTENAVLDTGTKVVAASQAPVAVRGVRLADESAQTFFQADLPSVEVEERYDGDAGIPIWTFSGTAEGTDVSVVATDGGAVRILDSANVNVASYLHTARIRPESRAYVELLLRPAVLPSLTDGRQFILHMRDGARDIALGLFNIDVTTARVGFVNATTGALIGTGHVVRKASYSTVALRKNGTADVELLVDGVVRESLDITSFVATVLNEFRFGCEDAAASGTDVFLKHASFHARTLTDFWNLSGTGGTVAAASPSTLDTNSAAVVAGDDGLALRTHTSALVSPSRGLNEGVWLIDTVVDADNATLVGPTQLRGFVESGNPDRFHAAANPRAFRYPHDVGKKVEILTAGDNIGTGTIAAVLNPSSFAAFTGDSDEYSNVVQLSGGPVFVTQTGLSWRLLPNFADEAATLSWEIVGAGALSGTNLTLRANPPLNLPGGYAVIVEVAYTTVLSAQVLPDTTVENDPVGAYYPFYLPPSVLGGFEEFLDNLTVAGVIPEVTY